MLILKKLLLLLCLLAGAALIAPSLASAQQAPSAQPAAPQKSVPAPAAKPGATGLIDINSASEDELRSLKGIGALRAAAIIKNRPYKGKDELVQKKIISQGVYDAIKDKIIAKQH